MSPQKVYVSTQTLAQTGLHAFEMLLMQFQKMSDVTGKCHNKD